MWAQPQRQTDWVRMKKTRRGSSRERRQPAQEQEEEPPAVLLPTPLLLHLLFLHKMSSCEVFKQSAEKRGVTVLGQVLDG